MRLLGVALAAIFLVLPGMVSAQSPAADLLLQKGLVLAKASLWTEAAAVLREGENQFPQDSRFPIELAGVAYRQKNEAAAKKNLGRALQLVPNDAYANDFLGTLYFEDGNLAAALGPWNKIDKPILGSVSFAPPLPLQSLLQQRAVPLVPGQLLTPERLLLVRDNLEHLNVLGELRVELIPHAKQEDRYDLLIRSLPGGGPLNGSWGRLLPLARELPYQAIAADFLNLRESAANVRTLWRWDPNKRRIVVSLEAPWQANPRIEQEYSFDLRDETWSIPGLVPSFLLRAGTVMGQWTFALRPQLHWTAGARLEDRTYTHAPDTAAFRNGWSAAVDNRLTSDWLLAPRRLTGREFISLSAGQFAGSRLVTVRSGGAVDWLPGARQNKYEVIGQAQAGEILGPAPLDQQFTLAMERDTEEDLWLRGTVETLNGQKGNGPIGRAYALAQLDLQRSLFDLPFIRMSAGPFFDCAEVGQAFNRLHYRGAQYDSGIEAKVRTFSAVTLLVVYGHNLSSGGDVFYTAVRRVLR